METCDRPVKGIAWNCNDPRKLSSEDAQAIEDWAKAEGVTWAAEIANQPVIRLLTLRDGGYEFVAGRVMLDENGQMLHCEHACPCGTENGHFWIDIDRQNVKTLPPIPSPSSVDDNGWRG